MRWSEKTSFRELKYTIAVNICKAYLKHGGNETETMLLILIPPLLANYIIHENSSFAICSYRIKVDLCCSKQLRFRLSRNCVTIHFYLIKKREPQSDSPSAVRKHTPHSIQIIYKIIIKMQAQSNNSRYFRICGTCAKITAVNTSTQPTISRGANTSCNTTNPPSTANTDSRLITMDATAGSAYFCPAI